MFKQIEGLDDIIIDMRLETSSTICLKIEGGSMRPLIKSGDVLGIKTEQHNIRQGSIILFRSSGRMIAHRVIKANNFIITTKGDASTFFDSPVQINKFIGSAIFIERDGRRINIDTKMWKLIDRLVGYYSCVCGIVFGQQKKGAAITLPHHPLQRIIGAINMLFPSLIYIVTWRL